MVILPMLVIGGGVLASLLCLIFVFSGPSVSSAKTKRLKQVRERYSPNIDVLEQQMKRVVAARPMFEAHGATRLIPNREALSKRLARTGKGWTLSQYGLATIGLIVLVALAVTLFGAPIFLGVLIGLALGLFIPHFVVGFMIKKRLNDFVVRFPDGIELMVRGLRSGLPISETINVVGAELVGPIGEEFRMVADKIRIGKTMDEALQETAARLDMAEFQFFCITLAIQRETGGNLAETLSNLADVLRKRAQMKLKIKAMSSESKASAYIVGSLPFIVFGLVWTMNPLYLAGFFSEERLMVAGLGGLVWMSIGGGIMAKMVNFEI